jgi:anaerobic magnesium-protoporphyrin IX monomethyl ester cyclase
MLPYDGTAIKDELEQAGRLRGDVVAPDYDFLDPKVTELYRTVREIVDVWGWIHGYRALSPQLNWTWNETAIIEHLFPTLPDLSQYKEGLRRITQASNEVLFSIVDDLVDYHGTGQQHQWTSDKLDRQRQAFLADLLQLRNGFIERHQQTLMRALHPEMEESAA